MIRIHTFWLTVLFAMLPIFILADNNSINGTCPGETIEEINNASRNANHTENGAIGGGGNDRYRIHFAKSGTLHIRARNRNSNNNANYYFYVSSNSCGNSDSDWNIISAEYGREHEITIHVQPGENIYIRLQSDRNEPNRGRQYYALTLNFRLASTTRWIKNSADTYAYTDPSPYTNNTDITDTLSIPDARSLDVTISGTTERGYDFLYITDSQGNERRFHGNLSGTFTVPGSTITIRLTTDGSVTKEGPYISIAKHPSSPPIIQNIPDQTAQLNNSFRFDLNNYITKTDGDDITDYRLTCSIHGLTFDSSTGILNGTPDQNGTYSCDTRVKDIDGWSNIVSFNIDVTDVIIEQGSHDFSLINPPYSRNLIGNYAILGNTIECVTTSKTKYGAPCTDDKTFNDNNYMIKYIDIDDDHTTWNSSSSNFTLPSSYDEHNGTGIVWAGLFWQGAVNNFFNNGKNIQRRAVSSGSGYTYTNITQEGTINIPQSGARDIMIKFDNDPKYTKLQSKIFYYDNSVFGSANNGGYYAAYTDITKFIRSKNPGIGKHTITIANITTNEGRERWIGNYAGWSIVVIYREQGVNAKARNISIYNGYAIMNSRSSPTQKVRISGFKLPKTGSVNASFGAFAGEGEWVYGGGNSNTNGVPDFDRMIISKNSDLSNPDTMPGATDPDNIFDAILANIDRDDIGDNKQKNNNNGIDVENYDVSSIMKKYRDADQNISTVYIGLSTSRDYITPSMMAFSAELYMPRMCYNYDLRIGQYIKIQPTSRINREFRAHRWGQLPLLLKAMIRSEEADFDLEHAKLRATFTPASFTYRAGESKISPDGVNAYISTVDTDVALGQIAIGTDITQSSDGGTIGAKETTYAQMYYDFDTDEFDGKMDLTVDANITFVEGEQPTHFTFSTAFAYGSPGYFGPCASNPVYDPIWGTFNVENTSDSTDIYKRLPLKTQIAGKSYRVNFTSYTKGPSGKFDQLIPSNATVEFDMIDASTYDNNATTGFDVTCQEPQPIIQGGFVHFNGHEKVEVDPTSYNNYDKTIALYDTAFRIWILTKKDTNSSERIIVNHQCESATDSSCFDDLYRDVYQNADDNTTHYCTSDCSGSSGSSCYECLRKYFAQPICSRDNFAIRPEGFRVAVNDTNEEDAQAPANLLSINDDSSPVGATKDVNLSAGYQYQLKIEATLYGNHGEYNNPDKRVKAYYNHFDDNQTVNPLPAHIRTRGNVALLDFNDSTKCADKNNEAYKIVMIDGKVPSNTPTFIHKNAGRYRFWVTDADWTRVDQGDYKYKTVFDPACASRPSAIDGANSVCYDCIPGSMTTQEINGKVGCTVSSSVSSQEPTDYANDNYVDLNLSYHPYSFGLSGIQLQFNPQTAKGYLFMNDFNSTYYEDPAVQSIDMGAIFSGPVIALGKQGTKLSNYTKSCASEDVSIQVATGDFNGTMQEYLQYGSSANSYADMASSIDNSPISLTLPREAFDDINISETNSSNSTVSGAGTAQLILSTTIRKPQRSGIGNGHHGLNPVKFLYKSISATGNNDRSKADTATSPTHLHTPTGNNDFNRSVIFLYGKITPKNRFYDNVQSGRATTPLFVDAYCNKGLTICRDEYNLTTLSKGENENSSVWYWVEDRFTFSDGSNGIGVTDLDSNVISERNVPHYLSIGNDNPTTASIQDMGFDSNATRSDLVVSVAPNTYRPTIVKVCYYPVPWLIYAPCDPHHPSREKDFHRVRFVGKSAWAGVGSTGKVVNTKSSNEGKTRMNW